jgi:uncharacterized protein (TIRG00374 family)
MLLIVDLALLSFAGVQMQRILHGFSKKMTFGEGFYLSVVSNAANSLIPMRAGTMIRAVYMRTYYQFSYANFLAVLSGSQILTYAVNAVLALGALFWLHFRGHEAPVLLILFFGTLFVVSVSLTFVRLPDHFLPVASENPAVRRFARILKEIINGWNLLLRNRRLLNELFILTAVGFLLLYIETYIEFQALGVDVSWSQVVLYACLTSASLIIGLTPGALGVREVVQIAFSKYLGMNVTQILQVSLLERGFFLIVLFFTFIGVRWLGPKSMREHEARLAANPQSDSA